jgi:NADH:ubiquinone oxidoreductase subunit E
MDDLFPPRTHEQMDLDRVWDLGDALADRLDEGGEAVTPSLLSEVARAQGAGLEEIYVAAGLDPDAQWKRAHEVAFVVCTGSCQAWGAVDALRALLEERRVREAAGRPSFDILTTACLDVCLPQPPYVVSHGPLGKAVHPGATGELLLEAVIARVDGDEGSE